MSLTRWLILILATAALAAALALYHKHGATLFSSENLTVAEFKPIDGALAQRAKMDVTSIIGAEILSSTQPVETLLATIPLNYGYTFTESESDHQFTKDVGDHHHQVAQTPVSKGALFMFRGEDVCDAQGRCPVVLFPLNEDQSLGQPIFQYNVFSARVSDKLTNGNPDIELEMERGRWQRLVWDPEGEYPVYRTVYGGSN